MVLRMAVTMVAAVSRIGAAQRTERLQDLADRGAEPFEHRLDDMVAQDQDSLGLDLGGEMAIADVPGKAGEVNGDRGREPPAVPRPPR